MQRARETSPEKGKEDGKFALYAERRMPVCKWSPRGIPDFAIGAYE